MTVKKAIFIVCIQYTCTTHTHTHSYFVKWGAVKGCEEECSTGRIHHSPFHLLTYVCTHCGVPEVVEVGVCDLHHERSPPGRLCDKREGLNCLKETMGILLAELHGQVWVHVACSWRDWVRKTCVGGGRVWISEMSCYTIFIYFQLLRLSTTLYSKLLYTLRQRSAHMLLSIFNCTPGLQNLWYKKCVQGEFKILTAFSFWSVRIYQSS